MPSGILPSSTSAQQQFDWSNEYVKIAGQIIKAQVAHFRLCHSRCFFVCAYPNQKLEMLIDAHNRAFAYWCGVPKCGIYDNMKTAVKRIGVGKEREFNEQFLLKLCLHSYSCLFGTFLCDSFEERVRENLFERTFSIWSYLCDRSRHEFTNYLYDEATYGDQVLYPQFEIANLSVWFNLYCDSDMHYLIRDDEKCLIEEEQQQQSNTLTLNPISS